MTIFTSNTDEMLAARFDPEPWKDDFGNRYANISDVPDRYSAIFAPRPEFIPSRDPEPWVDPDFYGSPYRIARVFSGTTPGVWRWSPRPEYARPEPNPILVAMRRPHWVYSVNPAEWLAALDDQPLPDGTEHCWHHVQIVESGATPAQIEDARKVLTRLANVYKEV